MVDSTIRSLALLDRTGSTARLLNLNAIAPRAMDLDPDSHVPFFRNPRLNRSIVVKHRVRGPEQALFEGPAVTTTTKVMFPLDGGNLGAGAWFLMLGQKDFDVAAEALVGQALRPARSDRIILEALAKLPSLDPFLVREALRRYGHAPSRGYFSISDADTASMREFVQHEIEGLVRLAAGPCAMNLSARLAAKLLSPSSSCLEPLKDALRLSDETYFDGMFSWRGFLYYKWTLSRVACGIGGMTADIARLSSASGSGADGLRQVTARISQRVTDALGEASALLQAYDASYEALLRGDAPNRFRDFILAAPDMFMKLGEACGVLQDATSYWNYMRPRFRPGAPEALVTGYLAEFEESLLLAAA